MRTLLLCLLCAVPAMAVAQAAQPVWQMQEAGTTAGLRGIDSVDGTVAWASGTGGTVLRTIDGGSHWTKCAVPDGDKDGATLDFRGVQAWDAQTAIVMASGPGEKSRLYKTADGCGTWSLVFTNPDSPNGFWDAFLARVIETRGGGMCASGSKVIAGTILGDPAVHKSNQWDTSSSASFYLANFQIGLRCSDDKLNPSQSSIFSLPAEEAFAASNSLLALPAPGSYWMVVGKRLIQLTEGRTVPNHYEAWSFCDIGIPITPRSASTGVFSLAMRPGSVEPFKGSKIGGFSWKSPGCQKADLVVVGGDYAAIDDERDTAAFTGGTNKFLAAQSSPHGYRSTVQWSEPLKAWITAGTNGSDISRDDGRTWQPLDNGNWNALSLPFIVGPNGRIARLNPSALPGH